MKGIVKGISIIILGLSLAGSPAEKATAQPSASSDSLLIFTKTEGYRHASIPVGVSTLEKIASENDLTPFHSEDANYFHPDSLAKFKAVVFLNTTGDILTSSQQKAFQQFIRNGGGFMGVHAATDTEYNWPFYGRMIGAYFKGHPPIQKATLTVVDKSHPSTAFLPDKWKHTDEWYNFKNINPDITVLINLEESSYEGGTNGKNHPIAWHHKFEGGHIFYTGLGHRAESFSDPLFRKHLQGGLQYILKKSNP